MRSRFRRVLTPENVAAAVAITGVLAAMSLPSFTNQVRVIRDRNVEMDFIVQLGECTEASLLDIPYTYKSVDDLKVSEVCSPDSNVIVTNKSTGQQWLGSIDNKGGFDYSKLP